MNTLFEFNSRGFELTEHPSLTMDDPQGGDPIVIAELRNEPPWTMRAALLQSLVDFANDSWRAHHPGDTPKVAPLGGENPTVVAAQMLETARIRLEARITAPARDSQSVTIGLPQAMQMFEAMRDAEEVLAAIIKQGRTA